MVRLKKIIIFLTIFLLSGLFVRAEGFDVRYHSIDNIITWNQQANFSITIDNNNDFSDSYRLYYPDILWDFAAVPRENNPLLVSANTSRTMIVSLRPLYVEQLGQYVVPLNVKSTQTGELKTIKVTVEVRSAEDLVSYYLPNVKVYVDMPISIDPTKDLTIKLKIKNRNLLNISNLRVYMKSKIIEEEAGITLGPLHSETEEKTVIFTPRIEPATPPMTDDLFINLFKGERDIGNIERRYSIIEYSEIVLDESKSADKKGFLSSKKDYVYYNRGNVEKKDVIKIETNFWRSLFTSAKPKAHGLKENGKRYIAWDVSLKPYEEYRVRLSLNYQPFFYLVIIAIACVIIYYVFRSPLVLKKTVTGIGTKDGGISHLKVVLSIKNRGKNIIEDISVIDRVPDIADVLQKEEVGAVMPSKVLHHDRKGTIIRWDLGELDAFEEKILNYRVRSRLSVLGEFGLPAAAARFKTKEGIRKTKSNACVLKI